MILFDQSPQGSDAWKEARRGRITASRARDARDKLKSGAPSDKCLAYAMDVARERCGGRAEDVYVSSAMRYGSDQESFARMAYEALTGEMVEEAGLACTEDGKFGVSVDGLLGADGVWECKTMVSSKTLFRAVADRDISDYRDQCNFALWLLGREYCDLCLWAPDLPAGQLTVIRIRRDDNAIEALESDLVAFEKLVSGYEAKLRRAMGQSVPPPDPDAALKSNILARSPAIAAGLPASIFG